MVELLDLNHNPAGLRLEQEIVTVVNTSTCTPEPLYNTVCYNTVLDITLITVGPQLDYLCYNVYTFYSRNTDWIANTEIGLDPSNSVIKRLRCTIQELLVLFGMNE